MSIVFDKDKTAIINPFGKCDKRIPEIAIACYTKKVIKELVGRYNGELLCEVSKTKIYKIVYQNNDITVFTSPIGSPWAAMVLEDLISLGLKKIIYFGTCGVLDDINESEILIPTKSKREEGTSYHYIESREYIDINPKYQKEFFMILKKKKVNYELCNTWTTDAPYRETKSKVKKYLLEGIKTVEMESSALAAIGIYRNIDVFIFFYAADSLSKLVWNQRNLGKDSIDKKMFYATLALELATSII